MSARTGCAKPSDVAWSGGDYIGFLVFVTRAVAPRRTGSRTSMSMSAPTATCYVASVLDLHGVARPLGEAQFPWSSGQDKASIGLAFGLSLGDILRPTKSLFNIF